MDWESYNQDKDDDKLIDLLVFYGPPFPIKDLDGNEIDVLWERDESDETVSGDTSHTSRSTPPAYHGNGQVSKRGMAVFKVHSGVTVSCTNPANVSVPWARTLL